MNDLSTSNVNTKPCLFCNKQLESALPENLPYQPLDGGEIQFMFYYGSCKFDHHLGGTFYKAIICDDCAEKYVDKMEELVG